MDSSETIQPLLRMNEATLGFDSPRHSALRGVRFSLRPGEMMVVTAPGGDRTPLADGAVGLLPPTSGAVEYRGTPWKGMPFAQMQAHRSRIGRVYHTSNWVSNLTVLENVILLKNYHSQELESQLIKEADELAKKFQMPCVPRERPSVVSASTMRRAEWVRTFVHMPDLILLERPLVGVTEPFYAAFLAEIKSALQRGAAVMWIDDEAPPELAGTRWAICGDEMTPVRGAA